MIPVYNTVAELLKEDIEFITEDNDNYYVMLAIRPNEVYHDEIWVINKQNKDVKYMGLIPYMLDLEDKVKLVDLSVFKERIKKGA